MVKVLLKWIPAGDPDSKYDKNGQPLVKISYDLGDIEKTEEKPG